MTSIERTAYPRFSKKQPYRKEWLATHFSLTDNELDFIKQRANKTVLRLGLALQLKAFQYLGYFIDIANIPDAIVHYVRKRLAIHPKIQPHYAHPTTLYRHRDSIRLFLSVTKWSTRTSGHN